MRVFLLPLAICAACGFAPEADFTGKRAGDGIAPWQDLGPLQVCFGDDYLGAPDTPPGGFCTSINAPDQPCARDTDCGSREACICGHCSVAYCSAASDCSSGRTCSFSEHRCDVTCSVTEECAAGEDCFNGTCRGRCREDLDCQAGEVCNSQNFCAVAACSDNGNCLDGERCRVQRVPRLALEPVAVPIEGAFKVALYLELADEFQIDHRRIYRATSVDGRIFRVDPAAPILDDGLDTRAPSVVKAADGWYLYYEWNQGLELRVARSLDGIAFGAPTTVLRGGTGGAALHAPAAVLMPDGTVAVYYQIGPGTAIGLATGPLGAPLTAQPPALLPRDVIVPATTPGAPFWTDVTAIKSPHAAITDGADGPSLRLWFSAFGHESADSFQFGQVVPIPPNHSIGYARASLDAPGTLTAWPYGPVLDRVVAFLDHRQELAPSVVQLVRDGAPDAAYLMYYVDAERDPALMGAPTAGDAMIVGHIGVLGNGDFEAATR